MTRRRLAHVKRRAGEGLAVMSERGLPHAIAVRAVASALPRQFDSSRAQDLNATLELLIRDSRRGATSALSLRIADGRLSVMRRAAPDAQARAQMGAEDMIRLVTGSVRWPALLADGRIKFSGDPFLAIRFPALFRLPAGSPRAEDPRLDRG